MHLNRECRYPDLSDLFTVEDITGRVRGVRARVPEIIDRMRTVVSQPTEPDVSIGTLEYPLYFPDFETCADAVPRLERLGPWHGYPFQYSLHVLDVDGELTHHDHLHEDEADTLVAHNAGFERRVIGELAEIVPAVT